ncbi:MAG TPA: thioredoxin family protein [Chthoniobacterales bacterium]|jgi:protein disulfide-isomerase
MKIIFAAAALLVCSSTFALAAGKEGWEEDYKKSLAKAKSESKMVLLDFTGSDWCGWCIKIDKEIFSQKAFQDYAKDNLVLVELDFPRNKTQTDELKAQNKKLAKEYEVQGYPTIIVLDKNGKKAGELGYMEGGAEAFVEELKKLKGK